MSGKIVIGGPAKKPRLTSSFAIDELALAYCFEAYGIKTIKNEMSRLRVFEEQQKEVENEKKKVKEEKKKVEEEKKKVQEEKKKAEEEKMTCRDNSTFLVEEVR